MFMILICKQQQNSQVSTVSVRLTNPTSSGWLTLTWGEKSEKDTIETQENKAL